MPFTFQALAAGRYREVSLSRTHRRYLHKHQLGIRVIGNGEIATVDSSMSDGITGIVSAATVRGVRLAWNPSPAALGYVVLRNGKLRGKTGTGVSTFTDPSVRPGETYEYVVAPLLDKSANADLPVWGLRITTPERRSSDGTSKEAVTRSALLRATTTTAAATTTLTWDAFIPQAKIDAPSLGCDYGSGYQFGGDNRGFDWTSSRYRTALNTVITWSTKAVRGFTSVRPTTVYRKSTGALVAQRTAYAGDLVAKKLGDGVGRVDIRMVNHASNPFCQFGAIDGAITFNIYQNGNWTIRSGTYRRMPNHEIYIYNGGRVTYLIRSPYQSVYCLIGPVACDSANVTGYYGRYA